MTVTVEQVDEKVHALEVRVSRTERDAGEIRIELRNQKDDIQEVKDALSIMNDMNKIIGGLQNQNKVTWALLLLQTSSLIGFAFFMVRYIVSQ